MRFPRGLRPGLRLFRPSGCDFMLESTASFHHRPLQSSFVTASEARLYHLILRNSLTTQRLLCHQRLLRGCYSVRRFHFAQSQHQTLGGTTGFEELCQRHLDDAESTRLKTIGQLHADFVE